MNQRLHHRHVAGRGRKFMASKGYSTKHVVLHRAVDDANRLSLQNTLASHTEIDPVQVDAPDADGNTCLHKAAWAGDAELCGTLLQVRVRRFRRPPHRPRAAPVCPSAAVAYNLYPHPPPRRPFQPSILASRPALSIDAQRSLPPAAPVVRPPGPSRNAPVAVFHSS